MTLVLMVSILIRFAATVRSAVLLRRMRDWRMGFLTLTLLLMTYRPCATLLAQPQWWPPTTAGIEAEWSGLVVSVLAFLAVTYLAKLLTDFKRTEAALRLSEASLAEAQRIALVGSWEWEAATDTSFWSKELCVMLGVDPAGPVPNRATYARLYTAESVVILHSAVTKALEDGTPYLTELEHVRADGSSKWLQSRGERWFDAQGQLRGVRGTMLDITSRKLAENALRASEEGFRTFVTASSDVIYRMSPDWIEMRQLDGRGFITDTIKPSDTWFQEYIPRDDQPLVRATINEAIRTKGIFELQHRVRRVDGTVGWTFSRAIPLIDAQGEIVEWLGAASDVSERKEAETALRESEQKLRRVLDGLGPNNFVGLLGLDGTLLEANEPALVAAGLRREDVLGRPVEQTYWFAHTAAVQAQLRAAISRAAAGKASRYDVQIRVAEGRLIWLDFSLQPFRDASGRVIHLVPSANVIEERKQAELKLMESDRQLRALLARLQRAREEERIRVSREIHDELGQLLTGLKMDVRWLERKLSDPGLSKALRPLLDRAVAATEMADAMIATVQKIAAELRPGALDQLGLAASLAQEARRWQERSGVQCTVSAESWPVLPRETVTELFYICREALTNVARHAHAKNVRISLATAEGTAVLEVRDDGVGLAESDLHAPRSLGLLGMRERAAQCGGVVTFDRQEPRGTRVTVRVPIAPSVDK